MPVNVCTSTRVHEIGQAIFLQTNEGSDGVAVAELHDADALGRARLGLDLLKPGADDLAFF